MSEYRLKIGSAFLLQQGQFRPKFQVEGVVPHQPFFLSENYDERSFTWCKNVSISFFCFVTIHAFEDRRTDGRTQLPLQYRALHYIQPHGKN